LRAHAQELDGPWEQYFGAPCARVGDVSGDGIDDLVLCTEEGPARIYIQGTLGHKFVEVNVPDIPATSGWRNVRVTDIDKDGKNDLVVVGNSRGPSYLRIFLGINRSPWFDFEHPYYTKTFPHATPDLEILDANGDNIPDICKFEYPCNTVGLLLLRAYICYCVVFLPKYSPYTVQL